MREVTGGTVFGPDVAPASDAAAAAWIRPRLGAFGTVGGLIPEGYERHLRVGPAPASDVAGLPDPELASALAALVRPHTRTPETVWFAMWEGYGWDTGTTLYIVGEREPMGRLRRSYHQHRGRAIDRRRNEAVRRALADLPRFELPHRRYHLLRGSLDAASRIRPPSGSSSIHDTPRTQAADLWWPDDRSWFVATDTDLDVVYVGGRADLVVDLERAFPARTQLVRRDDAL